MKRGRPSFWNKEKVLKELKILHNKLKKRPVKRDSSLLYFMSRKFYGTWNNAMKAAGYKIKEIQYIDSIKISPELCYFIGLVITDGHLQFLKTNKNSKHYKILLFTSYENEKEMIKLLIKKLFNYKPFIRKKKYGWNVLTNYEIHISSKNLLMFLNKKFDIPIGAKSKIIKVPRFFFNTTIDNVGNFLRGVIDGDGGIILSQKSIEIYSGSAQFLKELKNLLIKNGIKASNINKNKNTYEITISKKESIKKLYRIIYPAEFYYGRKKEMLDKLLNKLN